MEVISLVAIPMFWVECVPKELNWGDSDKNTLWISMT